MSFSYLVPRSALLLLFTLASPCGLFAAESLSGVTNFHKVDDHVYRGAQPTEEGFHNLAKLGVKTVVDLREAGTRSVLEAALVSAAGMQYISIPMKEKALPIDSEVGRVLHLLEDGTTGPVFVHCHQGVDRTGGVIACYRINHDKWQNSRALSEARSLGMHWDQFAIQKYVKAFTTFKVEPPTLVAGCGEPPAIVACPH